MRVSAHTAGATVVNRAICAGMTTMINQGSLARPLQRSACAPTGRGGKAGQRFNCTVSAAGVSYRFVGVVEAPTRTIDPL